MKKFLFIIVLLFFPLAFAQAEQNIDDYKVKININIDGSVLVVEDISYNFGQERRHGIFRNIPVKYKARGGNYNLRLNDIKVTDENGDILPFKVSVKGGDKIIKIGDPNNIITGKKRYRISYRVERAINFFDDHDEFYWDAIGTQWDIGINQSRANIILPTVIKEGDLQTKCFAGAFNSNRECLSKRYIYTGKNSVKEVVFTADRMHPHEGMTVVIGLPKGVIQKPSMFSVVLDIVRDNWILGLPFLTFFVLLYLWFKRGRDPRGRKTIVAQFEAPDGLSPAEVGSIIDERADQKDISAEIIYLAVLGYIKIHKLAKEGLIFKTSDYVLSKLKNESDLENKFDKRLMAALFKEKHIKASLEFLTKALKKQQKVDTNSASIKILSWILEKNGIGGKETDDKKPKSAISVLGSVKLSELKDSFYEDLANIKKDIYNTTVEKGYFKVNPNKVRNLYRGIGSGIILASFFSGNFLGEMGFVGLAVSGVLVFAFSFIMPQKTKKGILAKEHILGLKEYLRVAEKDRLKFHNAPEKNPQHFEKLLPYAMVLGVEKEWAKQFVDIYKDQQPSWYSDSGAGVFNAVVLSSSLNSFSAKANSSLASRPSSASSGGSGFSGGGVGGGFGGGGGGSW